MKKVEVIEGNLQKMRLGLFLTLTLTLIFSLGNKQCLATTTKAQMKLMADEMIIVFPYLFSQEEFLDEKNSVKISKSLNEMEKIIKRVEGHFKHSSSVRQISYDIFKNHLEETNFIYQGPNKIFAQTMLRSLTQLCMSCHGIDNKNKGLFQDVSRTYFKTDFEFAEFHFMTRNYFKAERYYDQYIISELNSLGKDHVKGKDTHLADPDWNLIQTSLKRLIFIYGQIHQDPIAGENFLKKYAGFSKIPQHLKIQISGWEKGFKEWEDWSLKEKSSEDKVTQIRKMMTKLFNENDEFILPEGKNEVFALKLKFIVDSQLEIIKDNKVVPELLFYLAILEKNWQEDLFVSLGESTLKECVTKYPESPFAEKCLKEYKGLMNFAYSGSSGTHLPEDVKEEIKIMSEKVEKNKLKK